MNFIERNIEVAMQRRSLEALPEYCLPEGFALRWYEPGDEYAWFQILFAADPYSHITDDLFVKNFGDDHKVLQQRICFLTSAQEPVGTAAAWWEQDRIGSLWGRIH